VIRNKSSVALQVLLWLICRPVMKQI